jgi:hypothetical protein
MLNLGFSHDSDCEVYVNQTTRRDIPEDIVFLEI